METVEVEGEPEVKEFVDVPETLEEVTEEQTEVSINVVMGLSTTGGATFTIKLLGYAKKIPVTVLIDSGSTHSFIDPHIVKMLKLPVQPMKTPSSVVVANGQTMFCDKMSPLFNWKMHDEQFIVKIRLLKVGGCDMVLGMDWINHVAPIILNTRPHSISFMKHGRMVTLMGVNDQPCVSTVDTKTLERILHCGTCEVMAEVKMLNSSPTVKGT